MSEIRVTSVVGENGGDRVGLTTGLTVGPLTGTTGIGATITHQGHAQFAGVCTATSFAGNVTTDKIIPTGGVPSGGGGGIIQVKMGTLTSRFNTASSTMVDCGLSVTITPKFATSKILVQVSLGSLTNSSALRRAFMNIVRGSTNVIIGDAATGEEVTAAVCPRSADSNHSQIPVSFMVLDSPATTSATTYKVQISRGPDATGTVHLNSSPDGDANNGNTASTIIVMEVSA